MARRAPPGPADSPTCPMTTESVSRAARMVRQKKTLSANGEAVASTYPEPIAVCGIGLRLPGGVRTGDSFWDVLRRGQNLRGPVPADRFDMDGFGDALSTKCAVKPRHGYFLDEDLGLLNTSFFNMSKAELEKTDPQQRKALEVALECLWNAGETNWRSRPIGVYVGTFGDDWLQSVFKESQFTGGYNFSGDLMIANRISYELDLQGPRYVVAPCDLINPWPSGGKTLI